MTVIADTRIQLKGQPVSTRCLPIRRYDKKHCVTGPVSHQLSVLTHCVSSELEYWHEY